MPLMAQENKAIRPSVTHLTIYRVTVYNHYNQDCIIHLNKTGTGLKMSNEKKSGFIQLKATQVPLIYYKSLCSLPCL